MNEDLFPGAQRELRTIKGKSARVVRLVPADIIEPMETDYIVRPYIPRGEATWLEGVTKSGKTMVALDIIARITTGTPFINGEPIERANVAIITCEDDAARTLVPRLIAAGADRSRVSFIEVTENGSERHVAFTADLPSIEARLREKCVSLVLVDGTFGVLGVKDAASYTEAYETMLPLVGMVRRLNIGALIVRHVRKSAGSALDKGIGSVGFGALGRSTLAVAVDRDDDVQRIFAHAGCNVGPVGGSYSFTIRGVDIPGFSHPVARATWGERVEISADEAVAPRVPDDAGDRNLADEFLYSTLHESMTAGELFSLADKQRIPRRTLQRAAKRLGVEIARRGFQGGSLWHPPAESQPVVQNDGQWRQSRRGCAHGTNGATYDQVGERSDCAYFIGDPKADASCLRCACSWDQHADRATGELTQPGAF